MLVRLTALAMLATLALTAFPSGADAGAMRPVAGHLNADGSRYVVFREEKGLRIVDVVAGGTALFDFARIPARADSCGLGDARQGFAVVNCYAEGSGQVGYRPWVVDLTTLEAVAPPGDMPVGKYSQGLSYSLVGTHWIGTYDADGEAWVFWNWRKGGVVFSGDAPYDRVPRDVDTPNLARFPEDLVARNARSAVYRRDGRLLLRYRERSVRLTRCPCGIDVALSRGRAAWVRGTFLHTYDIRDRLRRRWRIPGPARAYGIRRLEHTRNRLFVIDWDGYEYRALATRWPAT